MFAVHTLATPTVDRVASCLGFRGVMAAALLHTLVGKGCLSEQAGRYAILDWPEEGEEKFPGAGDDPAA